jgi:hypothetical protein
MNKYNNRMVVIYYGLKTERSIITLLKWPPSGLGAQCIVVDNDPLRVSRNILFKPDCHENENN